MEELNKLYNDLEVYLKNNDRENSIKTMKTLMKKVFELDEKEIVAIDGEGATFIGFHNQFLQDVMDIEIYNDVCKEIIEENKIERDIVPLESITKENIDRFYVFPYLIMQLKNEEREKYLTPSQKKKLAKAETTEEKGKIIEDMNVTNLIIATGNVEEYLNNPKKLKEFGLYDRDIADLIISAGKAEEYLNDLEKLKVFNLDNSFCIIELIKSTGKVEEYLNNLEKFKGFKLHSFDITELIKSTGKVEEYLNNLEKIKGFYLNSGDITKLIKSTGKVEEYLNEPEKIKGFKLSTFDITELIRTTGNFNKYLLPSQKKKIEDAKTDEEKEEIYGNIRFNMVNLIIGAGKSEEYLNDPEKLESFYLLYSGDIKELIKATGKVEEYLNDLEKLKVFYLDNSFDIIELIKATGKVEEYLINEPEKIKGFKLNSFDIIELIKSTGKVEEYLKNFEKLKDFYSLDITELIKSTGKVEEYLNNSEKLKSFNLDNRSIAILIANQILETGNIENIDPEIIKMLNGKINLAKDIKEIKLPSDMTIGVEIESEGMLNQVDSYNLPSLFGTGWKAKDDGSLRDGVELVSPILNPSDKSAESICRICSVLQLVGNSTSERCGGHVHIGADYLKTMQSYKNLLSIYGNTEELLYMICNDPEDITSRGTSYAEPFSRKLENAIENGSINLENEEDVEKFINDLQHVQLTRYSGINFHSYDRHKTIEFRLANGTINPNAWIENINLFGGIIKSAEEIRIIQEKAPEERTNEDNEKLNLFNKIQSSNLEEEEKLELLLNLVISEEDRDIYRNRYEKNEKLLSDSQKEQYKEGIAKKPIKVKDIGKRVFTGKDKPSITEIEKAEFELMNENIRDIENQKERE